MSYEEYEAFANERDELIACECIPDGIYKGRPIDWDCEMSSDAKAVHFAETVAKRDQQMRDAAIDAALAKRTGCLSEAYEDRWPE